MVGKVDAATLKGWLDDGEELALLDVREAGQFGERHLLFAVPLAYSRFEARLGALVPNSGVRLVLCDDGDGIAERAARRAEALGYNRAFVLDGGIEAWARAGHTLYAGVFVPSKTFGELVELDRHTAHITADQLAAMREAGENMVIVDGRPYDEFQRVSIPGGICCPNGELALRIGDIAPDPRTTIVVNCAGRTRSIIGAQTLVDLGIANRVVALENGTQGWFLAGHELEHGATARYPDSVASNLDGRRARTRQLAEARGARFVGPGEVAGWIADAARTTYLFDIRTSEEYRADGPASFVHAPGGQLVQAGDQWIAVRGARVVVADSEMIRAPVIAAWLRQLGHDAHVLDGGVSAAAGLETRGHVKPAPPPALPQMDAAALGDHLRRSHAQIIDLRASADYRDGHIAGAVWSIRPRITGAISDASAPVVLVCDEPEIASLAAVDLGQADITDIRLLAGGPAEWQAAGLTLEATPDKPSDDERLDFLFFTHGRLQGDADASRQYLAWEIGLVDQLDEQERAAFRIIPAP